MVNIYMTTLIKAIPQMRIYTKIMSFGTISSIAEMFITFYICGTTHEKSAQVFTVLDELTENDFNDYQYNEWLLFKNIDTKTTFGFTIGYFASITTATLITVKIINNKN